MVSEYHRSTMLRVAVCTAALSLLWTSAAAREDATMIAELELREASLPLREEPGWEKPRKIVVAVGSVDRLSWLSEVTAGSGVTLVPAASPRELIDQIVDAHALIGPCIADAIEAGEHLRWVQVGTVGVEECLRIPSIRDGTIQLTNMQGVASRTVAEHVLAMMLVFSRQMITHIENQGNGKWSSRPADDMIALEGKTVLVVGLGSVGTEIARRAHAFRMSVLAIRKHQHEQVEYVKYVGKPDELGSLVAESDFVVNSTPLTEETVGLFDEEVFERMRPTAMFINVGRGESVVTDDLVEALERGSIAGAGLDVVDPEPLPQDHPLWRMKNVVVTPHVADQSDLEVERSWIVIRENLRRFIAGGKLLSVIDTEKGY